MAAGDESPVSTFSYILGLPVSLSHDIFFRLSVKDVKSCRSVCKSWRNIISDPDFSVFYVKNSKITYLLHFHDDHRRMQDPIYHLYLLEIRENGGECSRTRIVPNSLPGWFDGFAQVTVIGSSMGLISLMTQMNGFDTVYVINPILGNCMVLPEVASLISVRYFCSFSQGRIMVLRYILDYGKRFRRCEIFRVGFDENWRSLSDVPMGRMAQDSKVVDLNGVIHWLPELVLPNYLYTFDLVTEEPGKIPKPPRVMMVKHSVELRVLNNRLSLINYHTPGEINIWTMQEYGVAGSWTKDVILGEWITPRMGTYIPLAASLDGNMMIFANSHGCATDLHSYDVHQKQGSEIVEFTTPAVRVRNFYSYSPSFYLSADTLGSLPVTVAWNRTPCG